MIGQLIAAAIEYARRGWRVIPLHGVRVEDAVAACHCYRRENCHTPGKHPPIKNWREVASTDIELVTKWWRVWPTANIGIVTGGAARLVAIDIDGTAGRESLAKIEETHGPIPETLTQTTGRAEGGEHRLFVVPGDFDMDRIRNRTKMAPGIDVRAEGGLIVAAPSMHPTGVAYAWRDPAAPVATMPSWLIKLATSQKARQIAIAPGKGRPTEAELERDGYALPRRITLAREALIQKAEPAIQGQNGSWACLRAAILLVRGYCVPTGDGTRNHAFDLLWRHYNPICVPAWSEDELMHKLDSAEHDVSDEKYPWRYMIPEVDLSPAGRIVDALFREGNTALDDATRLIHGGPATNPDPTAGYTNQDRRRKRNTEGNVA